MANEVMNKVFANLALLLAVVISKTSAFGPLAFGGGLSKIRTSNCRQSEMVLGPIARNGMGYEDVVIGTGRRILPGDSVACYYQGSFRKGPLAKATIFDSIVPDDGPPLKIVIGTCR